MNIFELLTNEGHDLKKKTNREWCGSCPICKDGVDGFVVFPYEGSAGRFLCRKCGRSGDVIQLLRDRDGLSYMEACLALDMEPKFKSASRAITLQSRWEPKEATSPDAKWQAQANTFLARCQECLRSQAGEQTRAFLHDRGINDSTMQEAGLGWNHIDSWADRESWGLESVLKDNGKPKKLWLPRGLILPTQSNGMRVRIRIRRPTPEVGPKYYALPGSTFPPLHIGAGSVGLIVESELDGILVRQEAPQGVFIIALGSAQAKPDKVSHETLQQAEHILVALDADQAGAKASLWWLNQYSQAIRWPCPAGKDPSEAFQAGVDLRTWIMTGIGYAQEKEKLAS